MPKKVKSFDLHWHGGKVERVEGFDIADAMTRAGYGNGAFGRSIITPLSRSQLTKRAADWLRWLTNWLMPHPTPTANANCWAQAKEHYMHIVKENEGEGYYATAWCGTKVGMLDSAYQSVDNALKAIRHKRGKYPCQACLREIIQCAQQGVQANATHPTEITPNDTNLEF